MLLGSRWGALRPLKVRWALAQDALGVFSRGEPIVRQLRKATYAAPSRLALSATWGAGLPAGKWLNSGERRTGCVLDACLPRHQRMRQAGRGMLCR